MIRAILFLVGGACIAFSPLIANGLAVIGVCLVLITFLVPPPDDDDEELEDDEEEG